jgi:hypothetical protein
MFLASNNTDTVIAYRNNNTFYISHGNDTWSSPITVTGRIGRGILTWCEPQQVFNCVGYTDGGTSTAGTVITITPRGETYYMDSDPRTYNGGMLIGSILKIRLLSHVPLLQSETTLI